MQKIIILIFAFLSACYYIFFLPENISFVVTMFFKALPIMCFLLLALLSNPTPEKMWIPVALFTCAIGDVTLHWFIVGLSFFLLGHIFYIVAFTKTRRISPPKTAMLILLALGIIMAAWVAGNVFKSGNYILTVAILCYIGVILTMALSAIQTKNKIIISGAILFLLSDSILALNMFVADIKYSSILIMTTYYSAQCLFALSVSKHSVNRNKMLE